MPERVSGPPPLMLPGAALGSLAPRFCWQGQHFRLWTVPERVSGPMLPGAARASFLLAGAALQALDGARARFGAPPLDAARRSTWEPRGSFLLAGAARARFGAPPPLDADTHTHTHTHSLTYTCALTCSLAQTPNCIHCYTLPKKIRMWGYPVL